MAETNTFERKIYNALFLLFACLAIVPVWWYPGFITADGPCHVYNADVFKDFLTGNAAFYKSFYTVNTELEPNWFSHILLTALMFVFSPGNADKIVISLCVLNLAFGFRYFIASIKQGNEYMTLCIFPFLWQFAMFMGFYNYMLSIGCTFWVSGYWLRHHKTLTVKQAVFLSLGCLAVYFMHLLGIFLSAAMMGLITLLSYSRKDANATWRQIKMLLLIMLPALLLIANYVMHNSGSFSNEYKSPYAELWSNLKTIFPLQSIHPDEYKLTIIIAQVITGYFIYAIVRLIYRMGNNKLWLMPVIILAILVLSYFFAYESMLGGSYIRFRLECLVYIFALIAVATVWVPVYLRVALVLFFSVATLIYFGGRWGAFKDASVMVKEFRSLRPYIKDKSVVLPLKYVSFPTDFRNEKVMASKVLLFSHVAETIHCVHRQLIFLENYEANTGYFPLLWKDEVNPFKHLGPAIEATPPDVNIAKYNLENRRIDYIVVWGRRGEILENPLTQSVSDTINMYYDRIYATPLYNIELYRLKHN